MSGDITDVAPLVEQAHRIVDEARGRDLSLRVTGALAFYIRCPEYNYIQRDTGRSFKDVDFAAYFPQMRDIERLFQDLGFTEDRRLKTVPGIRRSIFYHPEHPWHSDVFYDVLDFSHEIDLRGRLELDYPTIPLVDLLLQKLQIVQINEKDVVDALMLVREHELGGPGIDADHLARLCKSDWGLWKTSTENLRKFDRLLDNYDFLDPEDRRVIRDRMRALEQRIEEEPATLRWKLRNRVGERIKWYRDVDEVM